MTKKKKILIIVLIVVAIITVEFFAINKYVDSLLKNSNVEEKEDEKELEVNENKEEIAHEVLNIMIVGADNLDEVSRYSSYVEERSDVLKILSLDYTDNEVKLTSIDRDVVIYLPGTTREYGRFNWAYSFGGSKLAMDTINYNLDLDVEDYITFSFAGFIKVIDILGGVDIELTQKEADAFNNVIKSNTVMRIHAVEGINHLDGYDALSYARQRYIDSDFNRMERQNKLIKAVVIKLKDSSVIDLISIISECLPYVNTNLSIDAIKDLLVSFNQYDLDNIKTYSYPKNLAEDVCINKDSMGGYIVRDYSQQVVDLHQFLYEIDDYKPSDTVLNVEKNIYSKYGEFYENSKMIP